MTRKQTHHALPLLAWPREAHSFPVHSTSPRLAPHTTACFPLPYQILTPLAPPSQIFLEPSATLGPQREASAAAAAMAPNPAAIALLAALDGNLRLLKSKCRRLCRRPLLYPVSNEMMCDTGVSIVPDTLV